MVDILIVDYIRKKVILTETDSKLIKALTTYLAKIKYVPNIMNIWKDCMSFIGDNAFVASEKEKQHWSDDTYNYIDVYILRKASHLKSSVEDFYKWFINRACPNNIIEPDLTHLEFIVEAIQIKKLTVLEILYYFWKSYKHVFTVGYTTEYLFTAFSDDSDDLNKYFKTPSGNLRSIDEGMRQMYSEYIINTPFHRVFGEMDLPSEVIDTMYLLYTYRVMLKYLNDGYSLDGSMACTVKAIRDKPDGFIRQTFTIPDDIFSVKNIFEWCDNVRDYFSEMPCIDEFITLPLFTMERLENIITGNVVISGELSFLKRQHEHQADRTVSVSKNVTLTGDF